MSDEHPDMAYASMAAALNFQLADELTRQGHALTLATIWGGDVSDDYLRRSEGADALTAELLMEEMHAEQLAKPRPGPRGILGNGGVL